jgi:DNA invertase Pin-like site-specific DNA recombinase
MTNWKALLYLQVAAEEVTNPEYSIASQEKQLRDHCNANDIEIVGVYSDITNISTIERPGFKSLIEWIKQNEYVADLILITQWQKIMRNVDEAKAVLHGMDEVSIYAEAIDKRNSMK